MPSRRDLALGSLLVLALAAALARGPAGFALVSGGQPVRWTDVQAALTRATQAVEHVALPGQRVLDALGWPVMYFQAQADRRLDALLRGPPARTCLLEGPTVLLEASVGGIPLALNLSHPEGVVVKLNRP